MATNRNIHIYLLLGLIGFNVISKIQGTPSKDRTNVFSRIDQRAGCSDRNMCLSQWGYCGTSEAHCGAGCIAGPCYSSQNNGNTNNAGSSGGTASNSQCPAPDMCMSKWGYCGTGDAYCGQGCVSGPCFNGNTGGSGNNSSGNSGDGSIINEQNFACIFNTLDAGTRSTRLAGLRNSGWKPSNQEEAAVFLAHVFHETDGLKTIREYCAPGCGSHYAGSWCEIQGAPSKLYYGRGWFQLSWPCNYHAAGKALGIDLLKNPDLVEQQQDLAVKTAIWYYNANNMAGPARQGDFAATTRIINGALECNGGPGTNNQLTRVASYRRIRHCFNLGEPNRNPMC